MTRLRWYPELLDDLRATYGIRRERATDLGVLRTDGDGHFTYPRRAWREARPILAWLCLVGGLLLSLAGLVAGTALVFAGVVWLIGGDA